MTTIPSPPNQDLMSAEKPGQLLLFVLASAVGLLGVMMVLLAVLNPSAPHDGPNGTITELASAEVNRDRTTYHYVVEFTLDGTQNSFEYSTRTALDVGTEIPSSSMPSEAPSGRKAPQPLPAP